MKKKLIFVLVALTGMGMLIGPVLLGLVAVIFSASASVTQNPCITSVVNPVGGPVRLPVTGAFTVTSEYGMRYNPGPYGTGVYRLHGGIAATILDETIGRAISIGDPGAWGVTVELTVRYRRPVPLDGEVAAFARITRDQGRLFEGSGEIRLQDGTVAVEAHGRYMRLPIEKIAEGGDFSEEWFADERPLPEWLDLPDGA